MKNKHRRLAVTLASSALLAGGVAASDKPTPSQPKNSRPPISAAKLAALNKAEIKKLLANVKAADAPMPKFGAMCYVTALPPERMEYVCPACGAKTLYTNEVPFKWGFELDYCRRLFQQLPNHAAMVLDESSFCQKCKPGTPAPRLNLVVRYDDGASNVVSVTHQDLLLLRDFLKNQLLAEGAQGSQSAIKNQLPRLQQLLGLDNANPKNEKQEK